MKMASSDSPLVLTALSAVQDVSKHAISLANDKKMEELLHACAVLTRRVKAKQKTDAALAKLEAEDAVVAAGGTRPKRPREDNEPFHNRMVWTFVKMPWHDSQIQARLLQRLTPQDLSVLDSTCKRFHPFCVIE